jgi:hypothetical protein
MFIEHEPFCKTIELEWKDNKPFVSCVPPGRYKIKPINSPKFGKTWCIESVDNDDVKLLGPAKRTHILFHIANSAHELQGCIGVGNEIFSLGGEVSVRYSRKTFDKMVKKLGFVEHDLVIKRF